MPENETRNVRTHPGMTPRMPSQPTQPHRVPAFWKLYGLFGRQTRPVSFDFGYDERRDEFASFRELDRLSSFASDRRRRYDIFDEMDAFGLVSAVLSVYAEESTQPDYDRGVRVWIESKARHMIEAGNACLQNCKIEDTLFAVTRRMCKYGDSFQRLLYASEKGVLGWRYANQHNMTRTEDKYGRLVGFKEHGAKFRKALHPDGSDTSFPWDYLHFRLLGKNEEDGYGTGMCENFFREWRTMCVAQGTLIWTDEGSVPIENLREGASVYCHDPETKRTSATSVVGVVEQGVRDLVTVRTYHRSIAVTPDHGLLIRDQEGNFRYKKAEDLVANGGENGSKYADCLVLPALEDGAATYSVTLESEKYAVRLDEPMETPEGVMAGIDACGLVTSRKNAHAFLRGQRAICYDDYVKLRGAFSLPEHHVRYRKGTIPCRFIDEDLRVTFDLGFARLFGFMLGDGWLNAECRSGVGFSLGVDEETNSRYLELIEDVFDGTSRPSFEGGDGRGNSARFNSEAIRDTFCAAGFVTGFARKKIPAWVYSMSREFKRELIYGLLDADAGKQGAGWRLSLSNRKLVEQVVMLCQQSGFGVSAEIAELDRTDEVTLVGGREVRASCPSYRVWINDTPSDEAVVYEPVTYVEKAEPAQTYDLQVEDELHNFVADGVVSHNTLIEDSLLMYRLRRIPDRNVILVDVGSLEDHEAMRYVNQWRKRLRKTELVDPASATYKKQWNPLTPLEDIFYPIRADSNTRIETLQGGGNVGEIYDLEHFRDAFFGAASVPKAYFGFEGEIDAKATLQQQDIRFARGAKRVQRAIVYGVRQLLDVHFTLLATPENKDRFDPTKRENEYLVQMSPISYLDEFERLELVRMRYEIVQTMSGLKNDLQLDARMWAIYILINFAKLPEEMVIRLVQQTSEKPVEAKLSTANALASLSPEKRAQILDNADAPPMAKRELTEEEKSWVKACVEASPRLQGHVRNFEELAEDELVERARQQMDPSLLPVEIAGSGTNYLLEDEYEEDAEIKDLWEDVRILRNAAEAALTIEIQLDEGQDEATDEQLAEALQEARRRAEEILAERKAINQERTGKVADTMSAGAKLAGDAVKGKPYMAKTAGDLS